MNLNPKLYDYLLDITTHINPVCIIETAKIETVDGLTTLDTISEDKVAIVTADFLEKNILPDSVFGLSNLAKLHSILNVYEYKKSSTNTPVFELQMNKTVPVGFHINNQAGDFENVYRFVSESVLQEKHKSKKIKADIKPTFSSEITENSINRFKAQSAIFSDNTVFNVKTDSKGFHFSFGNSVSGHAGSFIFSTNPEGKLNNKFDFSIKLIQSIFGLTGSKKLYIIEGVDKALMKITIDSGLIKYNYYITNTNPDTNK